MLPSETNRLDRAREALHVEVVSKEAETENYVILTFHDIATKLLIDESLRQYASLF